MIRNKPFDFYPQGRIEINENVCRLYINLDLNRLDIIDYLKKHFHISTNINPNIAYHTFGMHFCFCFNNRFYNNIININNYLERPNMTNNLFILDNYDYKLGQLSKEYLNFINSLNHDDLIGELKFNKNVVMDFSSKISHCQSIYQLEIDEYITGILKNIRIISEADLLYLNSKCKKIIEYIKSITISKDKALYDNFPDKYFYYSNFDDEKAKEEIVEAANNLIEMSEDIQYTIYKLNLEIGFNNFVLGKETDEHTSRVISNASNDENLEALGIVKTNDNYDFLERIKNLYLNLKTLFYEYLDS